MLTIDRINKKNLIFVNSKFLIITPVIIPPSFLFWRLSVIYFTCLFYISVKTMGDVGSRWFFIGQLLHITNTRARSLSNWLSRFFFLCFESIFSEIIYVWIDWITEFLLDIGVRNWYRVYCAVSVYVIFNLPFGFSNWPLYYCKVPVR